MSHSWRKIVPAARRTKQLWRCANCFTDRKPWPLLGLRRPWPDRCTAQI